MLNIKVEELNGVKLDSYEIEERLKQGFLFSDIEDEQNRRIDEAHECLEYANAKGLTEEEFLFLWDEADDFEEFCEMVESCL